MQVPRIYVDTSVFDGCFDRKFTEESRAFFDLVLAGRIVALVSEIVHRELEQAPPRVRGVFAALPPDRVLPVAVDDDVDRLARAYVTSGVVTERSWNDAQHVAAASCARADAVISWNFRDLVASDRMRRFGAINLARGYGPVVILAPHGIRHALEELT